jgi:hypothetical protein
MSTRHNVSLFFLLSFLSFDASCQNLFGNPNCSDWQTLSIDKKITWLNAYLVPLNLTNVSRKKPKVDKFSQLTSLNPAVLYVDGFCASNSDDFAAVGAIRFLDELTLEHQTN